MNEKKIVAVQVELGVQRFDAKKIVRDIDSEITNIHNIEDRVDSGQNKQISIGKPNIVVSSQQQIAFKQSKENSSQLGLKNPHQEVTQNQRYTHILPENLRKKSNTNKEMFTDSTSRFFRDAFSGSYADRAKGQRKEILKESVEAMQIDGDRITNPKITTQEIATQTDLLGIQLEKRETEKKK